MGVQIQRVREQEMAREFDQLTPKECKDSHSQTTTKKVEPGMFSVCLFNTGWLEDHLIVSLIF